jgi:DNA-binding HxlR family transcriptional regulator
MKDESPGRYTYDKLSTVIHERARLSIMTSLFANPKGLSFGELKELCSLSDGNLSRHLQTLERAGLVRLIKGYEGNRPKTDVRISENGREEFIEYVSELSNIIRDSTGETGGARLDKNIGDKKLRTDTA